MDINEQTRRFIAAHRTEQVRDIALHAHPEDGTDLAVALDCIEGWQRARTKLPQWAACKDIIYPPHLAMEQCSSQSTAQYKADLAQRLSSGEPRPTTLIDITGGFGIDFSYMSRVFDRAVYIERQQHLCELAEHNMRALGIGNASIVNADAAAILDELPPATLIMADPARRDAHGSRTYAIADCTPDMLAILPKLAGIAPTIIIKLSPMLDWHQAAQDCNRALNDATTPAAVSEIHIVSVHNECKELLLVITRHGAEDSETDTFPLVTCVDDDTVFSFHAQDTAGTKAQERKQLRHNAQQTAPDQPAYLYEPNASLMKASCFDLLAQRFGVTQIDSNSHLFVSDKQVDAFPGRAFAINTYGPVKHTLRGIKQANIAVRNYPASVAQVRKRYHIADGGDTFVFLTTMSGKKTAFVCVKA